MAAPYISTSRTRLLWQRPPQGPWVCNTASDQFIGLVAWYPLGDMTLTALDWAPNATQYPLTVTGGYTRGPGPFESGMTNSFSGTGQYAEAAVTPAGTTGAIITFAAWFNSTTTASNQIPVMCGRTTPSTTNRTWLLLTGGTVEFQSGNTAVCGTTAVYGANQWHHACGSARATNDRSVWLDGGLPNGGKASNATNVAMTSLAGTAIGRTYNSAANLMNGRLADVRIYNIGYNDYQVWRLYDPKTRWDLYYPLGKRSYAFFEDSTPSSMPLTDQTGGELATQVWDWAGAY